MSMIRSTTNGVLKSYRFNLQRSTYTLNKARDTVLTGRQFNSYAEDPSAASRSFKLRNSLQRADSQRGIGESLVRKYEVAWSALDSVSSQAKTAKEAILKAQNDTTGTGRAALGQELCQIAEGMAQSLNAKYSDNFVFAGADEANAPFKWEEINGETVLTYRGLDVSDPDNQDALQYLTSDEKKFVDIGLGLEEDANGQLNETSAYNAALNGLTFTGFGTDADGDPQNLMVLLNDMGTLLKNCDEDGTFAPGDQEKFSQLAQKFDTASASLTNQYTELDTEAAFLKQNQKQLENTCYTLQEQIQGLENVDPADAITSYSWAQYCYNAALKVGNSILSQSLMDYMNS